MGTGEGKKYELSAILKNAHSDGFASEGLKPLISVPEMKVKRLGCSKKEPLKQKSIKLS